MNYLIILNKLIADLTEDLGNADNALTEKAIDDVLFDLKVLYRKQEMRIKQPTVTQYRMGVV